VHRATRRRAPPRAVVTTHAIRCVPCGPAAACWRYHAQVS
jgi:hypothetical protein